MAQTAIIDMLADPATHGGRPVTRVTTHISEVFLAGERAYKLKRAVCYPFVDFSTAARRHMACVAEVRVNRRTAAGLYLGVAPILGGDGRPRLGAIGETAGAVDWVVVMRRFDDRDQLDRVAERGGLGDALARDLADVIAGFHAAAEVRPDVDALATLRWVVADNADELAAIPGLATDKVAALRGLAGTALAALTPHLEERRRQGFVRACHGDLHLRNLCLIDGRPTPFDAIEFDDRLAHIDVAYDLAFLLMDLEHRGLRVAANVVFNRYVDRTGDLGLIAALPLFMGLRAAVRAKVTALAGDGVAAGYLDLALALLRGAPARLVAIGGLSGSGKSTLARALAPTLGRAPGALLCRSDVIRKRLAGVAETHRLPADAYGTATTRSVYAALAEQSRAALGAGQAVVADAVHARPEERAAIEAVARDAGVPFTGLWLEADPGTLASRVATRRGDASDADAAVVATQAAYDLGEIRWRRIDARAGPRAVLAEARRILGAS